MEVVDVVVGTVVKEIRSPVVLGKVRDIELGAGMKAIGVEHKVGSNETKSDEDEDDVGHMAGVGLPSTVFNVVKGIVGEGMLTLPYAISHTGLVPGCMAVVLMGILYGYTFSLMGRLCEATQQKTFKGLGNAVFGKGARFSLFMSAVCAVTPILTCLGFSVVISSSFSHVLHRFGVEGWMSDPTTVTFVISLFVIVPLCLLRDLSSVAKFALFGIVGEVYTAVVISIRLFDGSYAPGGKYYDLTLPRNRPSTGPINLYGVTFSSVVLLNALSTAFICHFNAPKFYGHLKDNTSRRWNLVSANSFVFAGCMYMWVMLSGYLTFGENCRGNILGNYSEEDWLVISADIAIGIAVLFAYPIMFTGYRENFMQTFELPQKRRWFYGITLVTLCGVTMVASTGIQLGLINSLIGAVFGSLITIVFPAVLAAAHARQAGHEGKISIREGRMNECLVVVGMLLGIAGCITIVCGE